MAFSFGDENNILKAAQRLQELATNPSALNQIFFSSYSGSDIQIEIIVPKTNDNAPEGSFGYKLLPFVQTISISAARGLFPFRALGEISVEEMTRGNRTVAGTIILTVPGVDVFSQIAAQSDNEPNKKNLNPFFVDEIPPFDIIITGTNEYGQKSNAAVIGVELCNFGTTFSVDDLYNESTYSYMAKNYYPLMPDSPGFIQEILRQRASFALSRNSESVNKELQADYRKFLNSGAFDRNRLPDLNQEDISSIMGISGASLPQGSNNLNLTPADKLALLRLSRELGRIR